MKALKDFLRPEFIGRVDEVIAFNALGAEDYEKIAWILMKEFEPSLRDKGIRLTLDPEVAKVIAERSAGGVRGARDIRHEIRRCVEDPIANILVQNYDKTIREIAVKAESGEIRVDPVF